MGRRASENATDVTTGRLVANGRVGTKIATLTISMAPSDYNAELAELAGGFIHEIKNHLSTFGLHLQLLAEDFQQPQSPRDRKAFERITKLQSECRRLTDVAN